jgi:hypothetical protein
MYCLHNGGDRPERLDQKKILRGYGHFVMDVPILECLMDQLWASMSVAMVRYVTSRSCREVFFFRSPCYIPLMS